MLLSLGTVQGLGAGVGRGSALRVTRGAVDWRWEAKRAASDRRGVG